MESCIPSSLMSSIFRKLPTDIIKYILPYDRRFIIKNGKIIVINKLNKNKYKKAILSILLLKKPTIYSVKVIHERTIEWNVFCVEFFSNYYGIQYDIGYMGDKDRINYSIVLNEGYCYSSIIRMDIQ
jgi:hypothetical protein